MRTGGRALQAEHVKNEKEEAGVEGFSLHPDTDAIRELLLERYPLRKGDRLEVSARSEPLRGLFLSLTSGKERFDIGVEILRGVGRRDPWMLTADALDALFGTFIENDRAYRDLPSGDDVEYEGAFFRVHIERSVPELVDAATRILGDKA